MKQTSTYKLITVVLSVMLGVLLCACSNNVPNTLSGDSNAPLRLAIAPYQDVAMLVNEKVLGLEEKYGTKLDLVSMPFEDIFPAVASAGQTVDVGFAGLSEYLSKQENVNAKSDDPVLFIYPLYVFKAGAFITFNPNVPDINAQSIKNPEVMKKFLSFKFGAQRNSIFQMMLFLMAHRAGIKPSQLQITDTTINDGLLASENGSLDVASASLTQKSEALKHHGRVVLTQETLGIWDITGFICKESIYKKRKKDIDSLIKMWFDCANYVLSDLDHHSVAGLAYLKDKASTQFTLEEYKQALTNEHFPRTVEEAEKELVSSNGKYSLAKECSIVNQYLEDIGTIKSPKPVPKIISLDY